MVEYVLGGFIVLILALIRVQEVKINRLSDEAKGYAQLYRVADDKLWALMDYFELEFHSPDTEWSVAKREHTERTT